MMSLRLLSEDISYACLPAGREQAIKNNLSDITYLSELILDIEDVEDVIRPNNLRSLAFRKLWAH